MNGSSSSPHTAHRDVWILLPWYVNGTLEGAECKLVREHLNLCITCRREVAEQQRLAEAISRSRIMDSAPHTSFARLIERVDRQRSQTNRRKTGWNRLWHLCEGFLEWLTRARASRPILVAVPLFLLFAGLVLWTQSWLSSPPKEPQYRTLASPNSVPAADSILIRVIFTKAVDHEQAERLLASLHPEIVSGPTAVGAYTVRLSARDSSNKEAAALGRLRDHPGVLLAELILTADSSR